MGQHHSDKPDSDPFERAVLRAIALLVILLVSIAVLILVALYTRVVHF